MALPEKKIPQLHARDLNGRRWILPRDLSSKRTLLLVAFERGQQASVDSWIRGLALDVPNNHIDWMEIPLLQRGWQFISSWIDHGMKRGITEERMRSHVWTVYTHRASFLQSAGIASIKGLAILVVDGDGRILEAVSGDFTQDRAAQVLKALRDPNEILRTKS